MKKVLQILMVLLLAICVVACGSSKDKPDEEPLEEGVVEIKVGISPDYPPYEDTTEDGKLVGFDIDLIDLLSNYLNTDEVTYKFTWVVMEFDQIIPQLQEGKIDLGVSGFTHDDDRDVEWSTPYALSSQVAVVNPASGVKSLDDLEGKIIAAQSGTTGESVGSTIKGAKVVPIKDAQDIITLLVSNQYYAIITDYSVAKGYEKNYGLVILDETLKDEQNHIVAKKGNTEIMGLINEALDKLIESDEYIKLCDKWGINPYTE